MYDLGVRLRSRGWRIVRLADHAADHFAHQLPTVPLLWRRVHGGYFLSIGELFRASLQAGYVSNMFRELRVLQLAVGVWAYWLLAIALLLATRSAALTACLVLLAPALVIAAISLRHRAFDLGLLSFVNWHLAAAGLLLGALRRRLPPLEPIDCRIAASSARPGATASSHEHATRMVRC